MRCHDCIKQNRPIRKPVDHFCDACGFAITTDGRAIGRTAAACVLVATAEAGDKLLSQGPFNDYYIDGPVFCLTAEGAENMRRDVLRKASDLVR